MHWRAPSQDGWVRLGEFDKMSAPRLPHSVDASGDLFVTVTRSADGTLVLSRFDFDTGKSWPMSGTMSSWAPLTRAARAIARCTACSTDVTRLGCAANRGRSPGGWSGNSSTGVQGLFMPKRAPAGAEMPLEFTLFTPTYRPGRGMACRRTGLASIDRGRGPHGDGPGLDRLSRRAACLSGERQLMAASNLSTPTSARPHPAHCPAHQPLPQALRRSRLCICRAAGTQPWPAQRRHISRPRNHSSAA